jgi:hypothetical protein
VLIIGHRSTKGPTQSIAGAKYGSFPEPYLATLHKSYSDPTAVGGHFEDLGWLP